MSTDNPLNKFNTYSYHHFLVVAKTNEIAESISSDTGSFFRFLRGEANDDGTRVDNGARVLLNPLSSLKYVIQELTLENIVMGDVRSANASAINCYSQGTMTILEPRGVRFFNDIYDTYRQLQAATGGKTAVWMIKTIFVGHNSTPGEPPIEYITNIKPMFIQPTDFKADFTEAGGRYDVEFVVQNNGGAQMRNSNSQALTLGSTLNVSAGAGANVVVTLSEAIAALENRIRENYEKSYNASVASTGVTPKKVSYKINLAERYKDPSYVLKGTPEQSDGASGNSPIISLPTNARLDQWIGEILKLCPKILSELEPNSASRWMPRVSSRTEVVDQGEYGTIEHFDIIPVSRTPLAANLTAGEEAPAMLEFDYIFTGKNVDVLNFDMKMNLGLAFFEEITASRSAASHGQVPAKESRNSASKPAPLGAGEQPPLVPASISNSPSVSHSTLPQSLSFYEQMLQKQVEMETISAVLSIRGNPRLFNDMLLDNKSIQTSLAGTSSTNEVIGNWMVEPITVRINVMMPTDDTMTSFEPFWYRGLFQIISIKHSFNGGSFTQELELIGMGDSNRSVKQDPTDQRPKPAQPEHEIVATVNGPAEDPGKRVPPRTLRTSDAGVEFIMKEEGFVATKYRDVNKWAIGYGHQLLPAEEMSGIITINGKPVNIADGITQAQAKALLAQDLLQFESAIAKNIKANLYQKEFDALVSLAYNIGTGVVANDTGIRRVINNQQYSQAPNEFRKWRTANKKVHPGLVARREREIQVWESA